MKKLFFICVVIVLFSLLIAQQNKNLFETTAQLFEYCEKSDYTNAAKLIVFSESGDEFLKRSLNPTDKNELRTAKKIVNKIKGLLKISSSHSFSDIENKNGEFIFSVLFKSGKQDLEFEMTYIKVNNTFLLKKIK